MSHLSFLGCEPARCGNWAARRLEFKRTVGVPHGVRKRRGLNAIFRPPTGFSREATEAAGDGEIRDKATVETLLLS